MSESDNSASVLKRNSSPSRKRSKVSRACDECRRKKVRCDAVFNKITNNLEKQCTHCQKNKEVCAFERTPLKRGPTKGYSKSTVENSDERLGRRHSSSFSSASSQRPSIPSPLLNNHQYHVGAAQPSAASASPLYAGPQAPVSQFSQALVSPQQLPPLASAAYTAAPPGPSSKPTLQLPSIDTITKPLSFPSSFDALKHQQPQHQQQHQPTAASTAGVLSPRSGSITRILNASHSPSPSAPNAFSPRRSRSNSDSIGASLTGNDLGAPQVLSSPSSSQPPLAPTSATALFSRQGNNSLGNILNPYNSQSSPGASAGLFWKVPFQSSIAERKNSADSLNSFVSDYSSSSKSYANSATINAYNNTINKNSNYDSVVSDSDDNDYRSAVSSYSRGAPASPANSFSSLLSINNNFSRNFSINSSPKLLPRTQASQLASSSATAQQQALQPQQQQQQQTQQNQTVQQPQQQQQQQQRHQGQQREDPAKPLQAPKSQVQRQAKHYNDQLEYNLMFYYHVVHSNFPILPLQREDFDILVNKIPNSGENRVIVDVFCKVLQILVNVLKKDNIDIINPALLGFSNTSVLNLNNRVLLIKDILHPLVVQLFQIYPSHIRDPEAKSGKSGANILLLIALNLINYIAVNCGEDLSTAFNVTFTVFSDLKIHRIIRSVMKKQQSSGNSTRSNSSSIHYLLEKSSHNEQPFLFKDGAQLMYIRLFLNAVILENIYALSFGYPRIFSSIQVDPNLVDIVFQREKTDFNMAAALNHFKVGLILCNITSAINFNNDDYSKLKLIDIDSFELFSNKKNDLATSFLSLVMQKLELIEFLKNVQTIHENSAVRNGLQSAIEEFQFNLNKLCSKLIFKIIDLLSIICDETSEAEARSPKSTYSLSRNSDFGLSINGNSNEMATSDNGNRNGNGGSPNGSKKKFSIQSPFLPLVFKQSAILANLIKIIINSMGFNKELLPFTSTILNEIMLINNYLPLIRPFNDRNDYGITNNDKINNNYNKFEFKSSHVTRFLDVIKLGGYIEYKFNGLSSSKLSDSNFNQKFEEWKDLIADIESYLRNEDEEGWLLK